MSQTTLSILGKLDTKVTVKNFLSGKHRFSVNTTLHEYHIEIYKMFREWLTVQNVVGLLDIKL
jgi:hypothetical protein